MGAQVSQEVGHDFQVTFTYARGSRRLCVLCGTIWLYALVLDMGNTGIVAADFTMADDWIATDSSGGGDNYVVMEYKPAGIAQSVFLVHVPIATLASDKAHLTADTSIYYTTDPADVPDYTAAAIADVFEADPTASLLISSASACGDPHIVPIINPDNQVYYLPTNDAVYKYYDNNDPDHRVIVNVQMWVLSARRIWLAQHAQKYPNLFAELNAEVVANPITTGPPYQPMDMSFARYVFIMSQKKHEDPTFLVIDLESLTLVGPPPNMCFDVAAKQLKLEPGWGGSDAYQMDAPFYVSDVHPNDGPLFVNNSVYLNNRKGSTVRIVGVLTERGPIAFALYNESIYVNDRNAFLPFVDLAAFPKSSGVVVDITTREIVPCLTHVDPLPHQVPRNLAPLVVAQEYQRKFAAWCASQPDPRKYLRRRLAACAYKQHPSNNTT